MKFNYRHVPFHGYWQISVWRFDVQVYEKDRFSKWVSWKCWDVGPLSFRFV